MLDQISYSARQVARDLRSAFEVARREPETADGHYWRVREERESELHGLVYRVHDDGDILPDDYRYAYLVESLDEISEATDSSDASDVANEFANDGVDVYTSALDAWRTSSGNRRAATDEALVEGAETIDQATMRAQAGERSEVFGVVLEYVRETDAHARFERPYTVREACVCGGTGDHTGQSVDDCDECAPDKYRSAADDIEMFTPADSQTFYVVTVAMAGYMPNSDPYVFETDPDSRDSATTQVAMHLRDELDRFADQDAQCSDDALDERWTEILALVDSTIADERREPKPRTVGVIFGLADDISNIEATPYSRAQLIELGYVPGEDFSARR